MSTTTINSIVDQIQRLPAADRLLLEQRLAELAEAEWRSEVTSARQIVREKGLDQAAIDQAISDLRYGK